MLWDPALFVFLFYRSLAEREYDLLREERRRTQRELPEPPAHPRKRGSAEARAQAIWSRRVDPACPHPTGTPLAQVIRLPRR